MRNDRGGRQLAVRWSSRALVVALAALLPVLLAPRVFAIPGGPGVTPRTGANTQLVMTGTGPGQGVAGGIAPVGGSFDPLAGYRADIPAGFQLLNEGFAGVITGRAQGNGDTLSMYCIDIRTSTYPGIGYENGTWDASNVPNVGYVARLLNGYYPITGEPASRAERQRQGRCSAVRHLILHRQVAPTDPVRDLAAGIVADVIAQGPLVQPPPPNLAIDPTADRGPADAVLGPFTVNGDSGQSVTVAATGASMFSDAAGTTAIPTNSTVPVGQQIWLKASGLSASSATLTATGVATVPTGNVFLYDGNTPGVNDAQRLILAETGEITVTVQATAEFFDTGSRLVSKTIDGPRRRPAGRDRHPGGVQRGAAGQLRHPGRRHRQPEHHLFRHRNPGHLHDHRDVRRREQRRPRGDGERHAGRRPAGRRRPGRSHLRRPVGNTYEPTPGSLVVTKTIAGSAARRQGEVVINVSCTNGLNQDIVIPAGTTADTTQTLDGLPAGTECTITETADGVTVGTSVSTVIGADPITIPAGTRVGVAVTNTCSLVSRDTTEPSTPSTSSEPVVPTSPTDASGNGSELPETGVSPELFMAGLIGALFVGVGAIPLVAGRRRGQEPSHRAGD